MKNLLKLTMEPFEGYTAPVDQLESEFRSRPPSSQFVRGRAGPPRTITRTTRIERLPGAVQSAYPGDQSSRTRHQRPFSSRPVPQRHAPIYRWPWVDAWRGPGRFGVDPYVYGWLHTSPEFVLWAQQCLRRVIGGSVPQSGRVGPATRRAIRVFQERQRLPITGVLDDLTEAALETVCTPETDPWFQQAPAPFNPNE